MPTVVLMSQVCRLGKSPSISFSGYHFSTKTPCLDSNQRALVGRVAGDVSDLKILFEPGNTPEDIDLPSYEEEQKRKGTPLRGIP